MSIQKHQPETSEPIPLNGNEIAAIVAAGMMSSEVSPA
jgi:hypothetical protein